MTREYPNLVEMLRRRAAETPERTAFIFLDGGGLEGGEPADGPREAGSLTFGELDRDARRLAVHLGELCPPGERALLVYPAGLEFVRTFYACLYAGVVAVPVPPPEPARRKRTLPRLAAVAADARPAVALTTGALCSAVEELVAGEPALEAVAWRATDGEVVEDEEAWQPPAPAGEDLALLQYTSGSTAAPKGVMLTHGSVLANSAYLRHGWGYSPESVAVMWVPNFHDDGVIHGIVQPVYSGYRCLLMDPMTVVRKPVAWLAAISRFRATHSGGPDFIYALAARKSTPEQCRGLDLASWSVAYDAAEPIRPATLERFTRLFAPCGFRAEAFHPAFGLAEATLIVTTKAGGEPVLRPLEGAALENHRVVGCKADAAGARTLVGCGRPILDTRVVIADPESGRPCPPDRVGEVWVASASIAGGYWDREAETAATFGARLDGDGGESFLRTGDLGFVQEGELFITGRLKDLIIIRGRNLYPQDLELTAERAHPAVRPGCCAAFPVEAGGEERLGLAVELAAAAAGAGPAGALEEIFRALRTALVEEHDVPPAALCLLPPGGLPKTSSGKLQRRACRRAFLAGDLASLATWVAPASGLTLPGRPAVVAEAGPAPAGEPEPARLRSEVEMDEAARRTDDLLAWLREYAQERINSQLMDERRSIPPHVLLDFGNRGLLGLEAPLEMGGLALPWRQVMRVLEQLGAVDLTLATLVCGHNLLGTLPIRRYGGEALRRELLPQLARGRALAAFALTEPGAGSAVRAITSRAVPDGRGGYRLYGRKLYSGNASWAGVINLFVQRLDAAGRSDGVAAFAVRQGTSGLRPGPEALTMGLRGMVQSAVSLEGVEVGEAELLGRPGGGLEVAQAAIQATRLGVAAMSLGAMKRCAQLLHRYASRRTVATGRLLDNPVTLFRVGELTAAIGALEAAVAVAAEAVDGAGASGAGAVPEEVFTACKIAGPELLWRAADTLVQLLGGRGYVETNEAPRILRDARVFRIFEGPTESLLMHLGSQVIHRGEAFGRFLAQELAAPETARRLAEVAAAVQERRAAATAPFADRTNALRWGYVQVGEAATYAFLDAAARRAAATSPGEEAERAARWTGLELEGRLEMALAGAPAEAVLLNAAAVEARVRSYETAIGDLEQRAPGADRERDPLLRRSPPPEPGAGEEVERQMSASAPAPAPLGPAPAAAGPGGDAEVITDWILDWLARTLAADADGLDPERPFADLGIDSVFAVELAQELGDWVGRPLEATILWSYSTAESLARHLAADCGTSGTGAAGGRPMPAVGGLQ